VWAPVAGGGAICSVGFTGSAGSLSLGLGGSPWSGLSVATGLTDGCTGGNADTFTSAGSIAGGVAGSNAGGSVGALTAGNSADDWPGLEPRDDAEIWDLGFGDGAARSEPGWPSQAPDTSNSPAVQPKQTALAFAVVSRVFRTVSRVVSRPLGVIAARPFLVFFFFLEGSTDRARLFLLS